MTMDTTPVILASTEMILLGMVIGLVIGTVSLIVRIYLNIRGIPPLHRRRELLHTIRQMKIEGYGYQQRLEYLQKQDLRKDVADVLLAEAEKAGED
jgi:hypothetical protein